MAESLKLSPRVVVRKPITGNGAEDVISNFIASLMQKAEENLAKLKADGYDAFFTTFSYHRDKQVIKIDTGGLKSKDFLNPATRINQRTKNRVKSTLRK